MASLWGTQSITILYSTFRPIHVPSNGINEIEILPAPDNLSPRTVLQQGGRARKRIKFEAYTSLLSQYDLLATDYIAGTVKTFKDDETAIQFHSIIVSLSEPEFVNAGFIKYSMELIEA